MYKQVIILRQDLKMGKGKLVAQGAHASLQAYKAASAEARRRWEDAGCKKVVLKAGSREELVGIFARAKKSFAAALIRDAGLTQVTPGEATAVGIGPAPEKELDRLTGRLKLL